MESPDPFDSMLDEGGRGPDWAWKAGGAAAGVLSAAGTRWLLNLGRTRVRARRAAGLDPDARMSGRNTALWTAVIAVGGALGRLLSQRALAALWRRRTRRRMRSRPS